MTRKEARELENKTNYLLEFKKIQNHFFKEFKSKLKAVKDPRNGSYVTYPVILILFMLIIKHATGLKSMRQLTGQMNCDHAIVNVSLYLKLDAIEELPHYDTINDFLEKLELRELEKIRSYMVQSLLDKRCFDQYRIGEERVGFKRSSKKYWPVAFDGTGLYTFTEKHCDHCLKREYKNKKGEVVRTVYMHHVLEAKLIFGNMVISLGTEFIENEHEDVQKQDCELRAFERLVAKIRKSFPRLALCLMGDSLYACQNLFKICEDYGWKYICRFKAGSIPTVAREFETLKQSSPENRLEATTEKVHEEYRWVNGISYHGFSLNALELQTTQEKKDKEDEVKQFVFLTNLKIKRENVSGLAKLGRSRWKIENEGFNRQKNLINFIQHVNSYNYNAMKNHYLIAQIADILMQLYMQGAKIFKSLKKTIKEKSLDLLQVIRTHRLTDKDFLSTEKQIQVRFP